MDMKAAADNWRELSEGVISGVREWRATHRQATLGEIEQRIDEQLARLRAQMIEDTALCSSAQGWQAGGEGPRCAECGVKLKGRGQHQRQLQTNGGQTQGNRKGYVKRTRFSPDKGGPKRRGGVWS
jgi:hypothetical protein